ncbi:MAG: helix-turn-helix domain-containing protein [Candidatus Eremiobacteraeota bacterium]|nr:helix-turn-helix domain-containing protein [Candidatus Eremiobacteraeota bacterium]
MPALGEQFRAAREARGLSLSEVAEQIRIRSVYLGEIEAENWAAIGAPVYVRGFLRTYARFLGLDPEEAVAEFNKTAEGAPVADGTGLSGSSWSGGERRNLSPLLWVASAIAVILIGFVIYNFVMLRHTRAIVTGTSSSPSSRSPLPSKSASPGSGAPATSPAPLGHTLAIRLSSGSWLRVTVDGSVSIEGVFPKGTSKQFHGKKALVRVGNAGGVEIIVNGHAVPKLGKVGDVAEQSFTL